MAIKYHEKSVKIAKQIGVREGEVRSYASLGNAYNALGKYLKAIECLKNSIGISKEIGDQAGEGTAYGNLGNTYQLIGEYHKAIECHEESLKIAKEICNRQLEGNAYEHIGNVYHASEEFAKAIEYYEKGLSIFKEIGGREKEGSVHVNLGSTYQSLGEYEKSIVHLQESLSIAKEIGNQEVEGSSYGLLGSAYQSLGEYGKAIEFHEKNLSIAKEIGNKQEEAHVYATLGNCYKDESDFKNLSKAKGHLLKSIECYEKLFDDLKEKDQFKTSFVDTYVRIYKILSEVQLQSKQPDEALLVCERARARALRDLLHVKYNTIENPASNHKSLEIEDVKTITSNVHVCILFYDLNQLDELSVRFWIIDSQSTTIISDLLEMDDGKSTSKDYLQRLVENNFSNLIVREGMKCEDRSLGPLESEDMDLVSFKTASIPSETSFSDLQNLSRSPRLVYINVQDDVKPLELLFHRLVAPILDKLNQTQEEIVIIPEGPLFMVPFAALQDPNTGKFLSETKRLRVAPSLTTLKILQESSGDDSHKLGALIIGDPAVGTVMYRGEKRTDIYPLEGARDEAIAIGKLLGVQPLTGRQATKETILRKLQHGVSVIHFAAHGSAQKGEIFLAPSEPATADIIPEEKDYMLTMKEVHESGIRAQLVVLSCCYSGRGDIKSEGVVGMTRAFLAAGARAVVASLWAVDDQATKHFMIKFYSHLKNGVSATRSLQQAMKEMRETEKYKKPEFWAAFFLIGDDVIITV